MTKPLRIGIAGYAELAPAPEIPLPLDEMIYQVTSRALAHAGLDIADISGACMAASDLNDGRAISTMTLTGSTGSFGKTELRVCNDSLAAVQVGAAEIGAEGSGAIMVCSWSKLSDTEPDVIYPLALEPAFHRGLGFHPGAVVGLSGSRDSGVATVIRPARAEPRDVAIAVVLVHDTHRAPVTASLTGFGASMGAYLGARGPMLEPLQAAADRACRHAGVAKESLERVVVAGMHEVDDETLARALQLPVERLARQQDRWGDLGYAAGLTTLVEAVDDDREGTCLVVSAGGLALENTHAIVVEKA